MVKGVNFWFYVGFALSIVLFTALNYFSYVEAIVSYQKRISGPMHIDHVTYEFGFPFAIYQGGTCYPCASFGTLMTGLVANLVIAVMLGAFAGVLFESIADKFGRARNK
jgi:hypothetical protein